MKRKRLTQRKKLQPIEMRLIRQAMTIAQLQASLRNAYEKIDVQTLLIDKLERQIHHEPRF